jgi:hypothetical protein
VSLLAALAVSLLAALAVSLLATLAVSLLAALVALATHHIVAAALALSTAALTARLTVLAGSLAILTSHSHNSNVLHLLYLDPRFFERSPLKSTFDPRIQNCCIEAPLFHHPFGRCKMPLTFFHKANLGKSLFSRRST